MICKICHKNETDNTSGICVECFNKPGGFLKDNKDYPRGFVRDYLRNCGLDLRSVDDVCRMIPQGYLGKDFPQNPKNNLPKTL